MIVNSADQSSALSLFIFHKVPEKVFENQVCSLVAKANFTMIASNPIDSILKIMFGSISYCYAKNQYYFVNMSVFFCFDSSTVTGIMRDFLVRVIWQVPGSDMKSLVPHWLISIQFTVDFSIGGSRIF